MAKQNGIKLAPPADDAKPSEIIREAAPNAMEQFQRAAESEMKKNLEDGLKEIQDVLVRRGLILMPSVKLSPAGAEYGWGLGVNPQKRG